MDQQHSRTSRASLPKDDSCGSLNINELVKHKFDNLLTTSLSSLPTLSGAHSFSDVPEFPRDKCSPRLFVNLTRTPTLTCPGSQSLCQTSEVTISVPTTSRMQVMLLEPISVARWSDRNAAFASNSYQIPEEESISEETQPPTWIAEGSLYSPEAFQDMLQARRTRSCAASGIAELSMDASYDDPGADSIFVNRSTDTPDKPTRSVRVPTITLSNSTAVMPMPLSLESAQCLASLAARRGLKGPAPLDLPSPNVNLSADGLYPGIPTPFLGSPSGYSPTFEFAENPSDFSLDLTTMCRDLRSRCPPLHPPSPPRERPSAPMLSLSDSDSSDRLASDSDSDDWAFAKDLMATHGVVATAEVSKGGPEDLPDATLQEGDSFSLDSAPTLTNSPVTDDDTSEHSTPSTPEPGTKDSTQQRRRRTVIIETPRNSLSAKPARITVDLSHLADTDDTTAAGATSANFDTPLPVEVSDFMSLLQSTPPSRPTSSATLRPIRSILKTREKKRVRFSLMPGQGDDSAADLHSAFDDDDTGGDARGRERSATIPQCRRAASPHHSRLSAPNMFSSADRVSFPRHPAAKSLKRRGSEPDATPTPPSKSAKTRRSLPLVPRVVDKAEVGAPKALSSRAARRSMPAETKKCSSKRCSGDENAGRRHSEDGKFGAKTGSPPKSRMPFRAILGKFRV